MYIYTLNSLLPSLTCNLIRFDSNSLFLSSTYYLVRLDGYALAYNMAAITTLAEAYTRLHTLNSPQEIPTGDSDGEDITGWLNLVADVVTFWNQNKPANAAAITIYNKELAFNSQQDRDGTLLRRHNAYNATSPPSPETDAELRENQRSWGTVDNAAVNSYVIANYTFYLVSAQALLLFTKA